jgi:hypothetical protein
MSSKNSNLTTVAISKANILALQNLGKAGMSYNDVITNLIKGASKNKGLMG